MPTQPSHRTRSTAAALAAGALLLAPLTACSFSSENVSCADNRCTVSLSGEGATATLLGTEVAFGGVQDGQATLTVGQTSVSCGEGDSVTAGPLELSCTSVDGDSVELTASLG
ncbi:hypothetical protein [Modestobacter roseus]|uniref:Uncharacterized protein n=1 Tax=Modestobacter roseus TaxID=1181884 RepID=A0A562IU58_9ACTN|nr:hypothetical protein [Modestobacter roseus]MQA32997.1 hypothetical protein [Modestobacter roseus]TWH74547.1 hypothetical protein JD78_03088 [Modestobacter roseus]